MKSKGWAVLAAVVAVLLAAWIVAAPFLTFRSLVEAARNGDAARLERLVDFPAVRESLKAQLAGRLSGALERDRSLRESPFGALGALFGRSIVDQVVDAAVTPAGVAAMVRTGRAPLSDVSARKPALPPPPETAPPTPPGAPAPPPRRTRFAYAGPNTFKAVTIARDAQPLTWVLERRGLGWKLAAIELPPG
jgi:hypothetical protein